MKYYCEFPNCNYKTNTKSHIHVHHIAPKELGGTNDKWNLIKLCPTHHTKIYIRESEHGVHSVKGDDSIVLKCWRVTTAGRMLEYEDKDGVVKYWQRNIKE